MADLVTLRAPDGSVQSVDPDHFDVAAAVRDGFRAIPPKTSVGGLLRGMAHVYSPQETTEMNRTAAASGSVAGPATRNLIGQSLPEIAATGAALAVPEAAPLSWLLRSLAAGGAAAAADAPAQVMTGNRPSVEHAATRGAFNLGGQALGEGIGALTSGLGRAFAVEGAGANKAVRMAHPGIDETIMAERIPVGRPGTTTGQQEIARRAADNTDKMRAALDASNQVHDAANLMRGVDREIADLQASGLPADAADAAALQAQRDAFVKANPNGFTSRRLDNAVRNAQRRAQGSYTKDVNGKTVTVQTTPTEQMFHRLLARTGRADLRTVPGVAATKDRARDLLKLEDVYRGTEATPPPRMAELANPLHAGPVVARRTLLRPDNATRLGFAMTNPTLLAGLREAPLSTMALLRLLTPAPPDQTQQGGTR